MRECRTEKVLEELEELEETRWLLSAIVGSGSRALHLHMKDTCMESETDGYEGDVKK